MKMDNTQITLNEQAGTQITLNEQAEHFDLIHFNPP